MGRKIRSYQRKISFETKAKSLLRDIKKNKGILMFLMPGLLYFIIFKYGPMYGITLAFKDYDFNLGVVGSPWVGLKHFKNLFEMNEVGIVVRNTLIISLLKFIVGFPAPIILALLLNEVKKLSFKRIVQTISYLPHFLSWVVVAGLIVEILSPTRGLYAVLVQHFDLPQISLLASKRYFRGILVMTSMWKTVGWASILYLASLSNIDPQLYEAAHIDGAGRFKQAIHVTIPGLAPIITILMILRVGRILDVGFDQIFNLYNPAVYEVADVIQTYVYRMGLEGAQYEFATAVGLLKNLIAFILLILTNSIAKRINEYALW